MTEPIIRTDPLGGSPLARAAVDGRLPEWYVPRPTSAQGWKARADAVRASTRGRAWLDALQPAFAARGAAAARLERVGNGRGIVVTTGQQPGLFGGPIYTWSKALSALALADEIEAATGVPSAPVFWAATDDADFTEASWTAVAVPGGAERLAVGPGAPLGCPMADMPLGDDLASAMDALIRACGATIDERPLAAARAAYRPGRPLAERTWPSSGSCSSHLESPYWMLPTRASLRRLGHSSCARWIERRRFPRRSANAITRWKPLATSHRSGKSKGCRSCSSARHGR
jgi:hypothetical protein